jgi:hypothetical protein
MPRRACNRGGFVVKEFPAWAWDAAPWDAARKEKVVRYDYREEGEILDRGVNFFVLTLEQIGARPRYSCEGHRNGFYIAFRAPYRLARRIAGVGFFSVEVVKAGPYWKGEGWWTLRRRKGWKSEREKRQTLRWAAEAWQKEFWLGDARALGAHIGSRISARLSEIAMEYVPPAGDPS